MHRKFGVAKHLYNSKISSELIFFYHIQQELCARNVILGLSIN